MKKVFFSLLLVFTTISSINAQTYNDELTLLQDIFGVEKQRLVIDVVNPSEATASSFWEVYNTYEVKRKELGKARIMLLEKYLNLYENQSVDETKKVVKEINSLRKKADKLIYKYYNKLKKTNVTDAAKFYQLESYIADKTRVEVLETIALFRAFE